MPKTTRDPMVARCALAIRRLREARGFSQEDFARHIGLHRTYMGTLERGNSNPTLKTLVQIAAGLGLSMADLMKEIERTRLVRPARKAVSRAR